MADLDLPGLIRAHISDRSVVQLARDCGGTISPPRLHQMLKQPMRAFPDPDTIRGLARGLGVSVSDVIDACAGSLGLHTSHDDLVIPGGGNLPPSSREVLLRVADELRRLSKLQDRGLA